jgi:glutaredoxin
MSTEVVLFSRPGCCLCDEARAILLRVGTQQKFVLREQDIEEDDALLHRYLERIPVVTIDGVEAFELFVDEAEFVRRLSLSRAAESPSVS